MQIPVYLSTRSFRDKCGTPITIRERRLIRQAAEDRVIAIVEAPRGTRIRRRRDHYGFEHLLVPLSQTFWGRLFGPTTMIPAKYVVGKARGGECGLSLASLPIGEGPLTDSSDTPDHVCAPS